MNRGDVQLALEIEIQRYIYLYISGQALDYMAVIASHLTLSPVSACGASLRPSLLLLENAVSQITAASQGRICGESSREEEISPPDPLAQFLLGPASGEPGLS